MHPIVCDLSDKSFVQSFIEQLKTRISHLDLVIHNAGYAQAGPLLDLNPEQLERQFQVNVFSINQINAGLLPIMGDGTHVVIVGSVLGYVPGPSRAAYSMTKYALESYADCLRFELKGLGIKVSIVQPEPVISDFNRRPIDSLDNVKRSSSFL